MAAVSALVGTLSVVTPEETEPSRIRPEPTRGATEPELFALPRRNVRRLLGPVVQPTSVETEERTVLTNIGEWIEAETETTMARDIRSAMMRRNFLALPCGGFLLGLAVANLWAAFLAPLAAFSVLVLGLGTVGVAAASIRVAGRE